MLFVILRLSFLYRLICLQKIPIVFDLRKAILLKAANRIHIFSFFRHLHGFIVEFHLWSD